MKHDIFKCDSGDLETTMVWYRSSNLKWREVADGAFREAAKSRLRTTACSVFAAEWVVARDGGVDVHKADRMGFCTHSVSSSAIASAPLSISSSTKLDGGHTVRLVEGHNGFWDG
ncbi:hypothetical protein SESBI_11499 [Sesbania bispinosa]|nr:hypothetical protein SESBI_11499 [Sesbania bispinosa]